MKWVDMTNLRPDVQRTKRQIKGRDIGEPEGRWRFVIQKGVQTYCIRCKMILMLKGIVDLGDFC